MVRFSKTELKVLENVSLGNNNVNDIAFALKKDKSHIYRVIRELSAKEFVRMHNSLIIPQDKTHVKLLLQELSWHNNIIHNLSGCGISLYTALLFPLSIDEIIIKTGIKRSTVFSRLKSALRISLVNVKDISGTPFTSTQSIFLLL